MADKKKVEVKETKVEVKTAVYKVYVHCGQCARDIQTQFTEFQGAFFACCSRQYLATAHCLSACCLEIMVACACMIIGGRACIDTGACTRACVYDYTAPYIYCWQGLKR